MKQEKKKGIISTWMKKYFGTTEADSVKKNSQRSKSTNYLPPILAPDTQNNNNTYSNDQYTKDSMSKASNTNTMKSKTSSKSLVFREKPPRQPMPIPQQTITIPGKLLAPPPREVIIEQEEYEDGPQEIIIERWLAYPKQQRKVIFETPNSSGRPEDYQMVTVADDDTLKNHLKRLGMSEADLQKIDWESFDSNSNLDPQTKRNIIYQSAPSIQPVVTPKNIFIDWEYDSPYQQSNYAEEPIDLGGTLVSNERRSNGNHFSGNVYEHYAKSLSNLNTANVKFLGIEEVDPYEYVKKHSTELIDSSNLPDYFKTLQVPVGEKVELAADKSKDRYSFDFVGDVEALDLVNDKNLYKF